MNYPVVYDERPVRKTRKDHKCCECRTVIPRGSACMYAHGIWEDDGAARYYWCLPCDLLKREVLTMVDWQNDPLCFGTLYEFIHEMCR